MFKSREYKKFDTYTHSSILTHIHMYEQILTAKKRRAPCMHCQASLHEHGLQYPVQRRQEWVKTSAVTADTQYETAGMGENISWYCCSLSMFVLIQAAWKSANAPWWRLCGTIARGRHVPGGQAPSRLEQKCSISQAQTQWCTWSLSPISWGGCLLCPLEILTRFPTPWGTGRLLAMSMASVTGMANLDQAAASFTSTRGPWSRRQTMASLLGDRANVNGPLPIQ